MNISVQVGVQLSLEGSRCGGSLGKGGRLGQESVKNEGRSLGVWVSPISRVDL